MKIKRWARSKERASPFRPSFICFLLLKGDIVQPFPGPSRRQMVAMAVVSHGIWFVAGFLGMLVVSLLLKR